MNPALRRSVRLLLPAVVVGALMGLVIGWLLGRPDPLDDICETGRCPR